MIILFVGLTTCVSGIILVLRHLHVWRQQIDDAGTPAERSFINAQLRRRTLTSSCIAVLGFIIAVLHFREYWRERPTSWLILVCCTLVLTLMIFVLASLDILAVSSEVQRNKEQTSDAAKELAREYHRMKGKASEMPKDASPDSTPTDSAPDHPA